MRRLPAILTALGFAGLLMAGLWQAWAGLNEHRGRWAAQDWVGGAMGREIERVLSQHSPWAAPLQRGSRWLGWQVMGDLGPDVIAGCPGWLFYREEFVPPDWSALAQRLDAAARVQQRLAARGIALVMLPVADKARIESAHLCGLPRHPELQTRLARIQAGLVQRGVAVAQPDWRAPAPGPRYFRSDTHWNPEGSRLAARAVAEWVRAHQPHLARPPLAAWPLTEQEAAPADLLRLTRLDGWPGLPPPESVPRWHIPAPPAPAASLLGDAPAPAVLLVGSSYSRNARFADFLAAELGQSLAVVARDGAGFQDSLAEALANPMMAESPPKLLIWEFAERAMTAPLDSSAQAALLR